MSWVSGCRGGFRGFGRAAFQLLAMLVEDARHGRRGLQEHPEELRAGDFQRGKTGKLLHLGDGQELPCHRSGDDLEALLVAFSNSSRVLAGCTMSVDEIANGHRALELVLERLVLRPGQSPLRERVLDDLELALPLRRSARNSVTLSTVSPRTSARIAISALLKRSASASTSFCLAAWAGRPCFPPRS